MPFLLTLPLGLAALWLRPRLRLRLAETRAFRRETAAVRLPPREVAGAIALGAARVMGWAAGYTFLVVLPSYLQSTPGASFQQALVATVLADLGFAVTIVPAGLLSDRVGRRAVMLTGALLVVFLSLPLLNLLQDPAASNAVKGAAVFGAGAVVGLMAGPGPAMLHCAPPTNWGRPRRRRRRTRSRCSGS